ncbi:TPA_asm: P7 [Alnus trirhavirus 1]|nr:TPA_asm: P7 [Alnus trirhavirus 1]
MSIKSLPFLSKHKRPKEDDPIPRNCAGTAYITATCEITVGFQDSDSAMSACLASLLDTLGPDSDGASESSLDSRKGHIPRAFLTVLRRFIVVLQTKSMPDPGLFSYTYVEGSKVKIIYHWSRFYFRNPAIVKGKGSTDSRFTLTAPEIHSDGLSMYRMTIDAVFQ